MSDRTETEHGHAEALGETRIEDQLTIVLEGSRPKEGGSRHSLDHIDEIVIGRGTARRFKRSRADGRRLLTLELPDARLSSVHAKIQQLDEGWQIEDAGSRNGTKVLGEACDRRALQDGDVIEVGRTLIQFRTKVEVPVDAPGDVSIAELTNDPPGFRTLSATLAAALELVKRVAVNSTAPILLLGETGTGKEILARAIHEVSGRKGPCVAVNCGALPKNLIESMIFGHVKGAFSGAERDEPGFARTADKGTLFLDEIGELPLESQTVLLRVLQEREVVPVGATVAQKLDIRVVAATNAAIEEMAARGAFRADLLARLAGFKHRLTPLRERTEDLGLIVAAITAKLEAEAPPIGIEAGRLLCRYGWPGNVRELEQCLTVAIALAGQNEIGPSHLPEEIRRPKVAVDLDNEDSLKATLLAKFEEHAGNITQVAQSMGKSRVQIQRWMKRFEIDPSSFRGK